MNKWWEGYNWRLIQTNLREIDMADIDAKRYVEDMKKFHANIAMINAAGIIASYPTKLAHHYQSRFLTGDSLEKIIEECHAAGIRVIARTDFSKIRRPVYEEHPDWAYRTVAGNIVDYEGDVHACLNGGYQGGYAFEIIRECLTKLDFDGIFFNMGGYQVRDYSFNYHGICHCENCKKKFFEASGMALPVKEDAADPVFRRYRRFREETASAHNEKVARFIKELRPDILINADTWTEDTGFIRQESNTALDRALPHWQYSGSENTKWVRGSYKGFISSNCSVDFIDFPTRHTAVSPTTQETRMWQNLANAGQLDYYIIGRLDNHPDQSGHEGIIRTFAFHEKYEDLYRDNESVADTALIAPPHWGGFGGMHEAAGIYRMLAESHYQFDVILQNRLAHVDLGKYKNLVLPGLEAISDGDAAVIDGFVKAGGNLLCTGRVGNLQSDGAKREKPALDCMGMTGFGATQSARGAYFQIGDGDKALFKRFPNTELIYIDGDYTYALWANDAKPILRMIPPQPFGPPERCYPLYPAGDNPAAVLNSYGKGKCLTIPWGAGKLFHRQGYNNTMDFVIDLLEGALGVSPMDTDAPPMVEVTLLTDAAKSYRLLHFVNQTGHFGNSFYPPVTIPQIRCAVAVAQKPAAVRSLVSEKDIPFTWEDGRLSLTVNDVGIFEAVYIK